MRTCGQWKQTSAGYRLVISENINATSYQSLVRYSVLHYLEISSDIISYNSKKYTRRLPLLVHEHPYT